MKSIKLFLAKYAAFIWALLKPLGAWGVFAIGAIDSSLMGMPLDAVVAGYVYTKPHLAWLYVIMASAGSAVGCIVLYVIGYKGGEVLLAKRMSPARFAKVRLAFERHRFLALMLPAMIPPPFPYKILVLAAAAFEMQFAHFMLAIFAGRLVRFGILAGLTVAFGPQIVAAIGPLFRQHVAAILIGLAVAVAVFVLARVLRRRPPVATVVSD